jgi:hypothetical protein
MSPYERESDIQHEGNQACLVVFLLYFPYPTGLTFQQGVSTMEVENQEMMEVRGWK